MFGSQKTEVKPNKENGRPLGIPTMRDRAFQTLYNLALTPIAECSGDRHSYGFRRYRSPKDAIAMLHIRLSNRHRPGWILEADIKGFFNNISHGWIMKNIPLEKEKLKQWLKAGHIEKSTFHETFTGVPQGGSISPTISNMVLDGLSSHISSAVKPFTTKKGNTSSKYNTKVTMIRFADDFVVTGATKKILVNVVKPAVNEFLSARGLKLNETKTKITYIEKGFDFLGLNTRLYKDEKRKPEGKILLIKPSSKSISRIKTKIQTTFIKHSTSSAYTLIHELNPIIRGWANYHCTAVSKKVFNRIGFYLWVKIWRWIRKKHTQQSKNKLVKMFFERIGSRNWVFFGKKKQSKLTVLNIANVTIRRHVVGLDLNPYDLENKLYFEKRRKKGTLSNGLSDKRTKQLLKREKFKCPACEMPILFNQEVDRHHKVAKKKGGSSLNQNLVILHRECHKQVTYCKDDKLKARFVLKNLIL